MCVLSDAQQPLCSPPETPSDARGLLPLGETQQVARRGGVDRPGPSPAHRWRLDCAAAPFSDDAESRGAARGTVPVLRCLFLRSLAEGLLAPVRHVLPLESTVGVQAVGRVDALGDLLAAETCSLAVEACSLQPGAVDAVPSRQRIGPRRQVVDRLGPVLRRDRGRLENRRRADRRRLRGLGRAGRTLSACVLILVPLLGSGASSVHRRIVSRPLLQGSAHARTSARTKALLRTGVLERRFDLGRIRRQRPPLVGSVLLEVADGCHATLRLDVRAAHVRQNAENGPAHGLRQRGIGGRAPLLRVAAEVERCRTTNLGRGVEPLDQQHDSDASRATARLRLGAAVLIQPTTEPLQPGGGSQAAADEREVMRPEIVLSRRLIGIGVGQTLGRAHRRDAAIVVLALHQERGRMENRRRAERRHSHGLGRASGASSACVLILMSLLGSGASSVHGRMVSRALQTGASCPRLGRGPGPDLDVLPTAETERLRSTRAQSFAYFSRDGRTAGGALVAITTTMRALAAGVCANSPGARPP